MVRNNDDLLREAMESAGYFTRTNDLVTLDDRCELSYQEQVSLLLAREVARFRPDLKDRGKKDVLYIVRNERGSYSLPSNDLTYLLETEEPYDDSMIASYSLNDRKIINKLYRGDGTKWIPYKRSE